MNKDKISAQDVIDSLAVKTDLTKLQAEEFFKALITTIEEALLANDFVKIKNLGTFKLNWVAPRRSVNVQTGENIEIDGHYKVVFTPEKSLKELINEPFAHLESVVLDEEKTTTEINPMASLAEQAGEIKGLLSEIQSMSPDKEEEKKEEEKQLTAEEILEKIEITEQIFVSQENNHNTNTTVNNEVMKEYKNKPTEFYFEPKRKRKTGWWILSAVLLLLGIGAAFYFFCPSAQNWVNKCVLGKQSQETIVCCGGKGCKGTTDFQKEKEAEAPDEFTRIFDDRFNNQEILAQVRVNYGSRLAFLAQRHYGSPHFWVYIFEANRDVISNPNFIPVGTIVRIPRMNPILIDPNNPCSVEAARQLGEQYLR